MAYHNKSSKKRGKKMYKKGSFLEPGKEIKFGGVKKMQAGAFAERVTRARLEKKGIDTSGTTSAGFSKPGANRGSSSARPAASSGSNTGGGMSPYAKAKKKDPKLDSYIKARNAARKGSPEYNAAQNKINKAYGRGPTNRPTGGSSANDPSTTSGRPNVGRPTNQGTRRGPDVKPVQRKEAKPVPTSRPTPELKKPAAPKPAAPAPEKAKKSKGDRLRARADKADQRMTDRRNRRAGRQADRAAKRKPNTTAASKVSADDMKKLEKDINRPMMYGGKKKMGMGGYGKMKYGKGGLKMVKGKDGKMVPFYAADGKGKMMGGGMYKPYKAGGKKKSLKETTPDQKGLRKLPTAVRNKMGYKKAGGPAQQAAIAISMKKAGKKPKMMKKGGGMSGLSAAQKQVYKRGLAAYMSSGNRPKVSQHAWAMARVKSDFGKREAAKIRAGKSGKGKKKK